MKTTIERDGTIQAVELTQASHDLFIEFAEDAGNWSGNPLVGGNVGGSKEEAGNLTDLKKKGLLETERGENNERGEALCWVYFTKLGIGYASAHGIDLSWIEV